MIFRIKVTMPQVDPAFFHMKMVGRKRARISTHNKMTVMVITIRGLNNLLTPYGE